MAARRRPSRRQAAQDEGALAVAAFLLARENRVDWFIGPSAPALVAALAPALVPYSRHFCYEARAHRERAPRPRAPGVA